MRPILLRLGRKDGIWREDERSLNGLLEPRMPPADWLPLLVPTEPDRVFERDKLPGPAEAVGRDEASRVVGGIVSGAGTREGVRSDWLFFSDAPPAAADVESAVGAATLVGAVAAVLVASVSTGLLVEGGGRPFSTAASWMALARLMGESGGSEAFGRLSPTGYVGGSALYRLKVMLLPGYDMVTRRSAYGPGRERWADRCDV